MDDVQAHHQFLLGKLWELQNSPRYFVPTTKAVLHEADVDNGSRIQVCKFRQVTTKPKSDKSGGLRILAVLVYKNSNPIKYIPLLVYSAKEEGKDIVYEGKSYRLNKSGILRLLKDRLEILIS